MEPHFTKNTDTNNIILNQLSLENLQSYCISSKYANNLCKNNKFVQNNLKRLDVKIDKIIAFVEKVSSGYYLTPSSDNIEIIDIFNLVNYLGVEIDEVYDDYNKEAEIRHMNILCKKKRKQITYEINIFVGDYSDLMEGNQDFFIGIMVSKEKLKQFLLHIYYDNYVVDF